MKMIKFIKSRINYIKSSIINLHHRIQQTTITDGVLCFNGTVIIQEHTLYFTFFDWLLGIVQYGLMLSLVLYWYMSQRMWLTPIALGLVYWLIPDFISKVKEKLRSEN